MGPHGILWSALILPISGVDYHDLVYLSVSVPVIVGVVDALVSQPGCLRCQLRHMHVIAVGVVGSVIAEFFGDCDRPCYIECEIECAV